MDPTAQFQTNLRANVSRLGMVLILPRVLYNQGSASWFIVTGILVCSYPERLALIRPRAIVKGTRGGHSRAVAHVRIPRRRIIVAKLFPLFVCSA